MDHKEHKIVKRLETLKADYHRLTRALLSGVFLFQGYEVCENSNSGLLDGQGLLFPAKTTIKISNLAGGATGEAAGSFALLVVDD